MAGALYGPEGFFVRPGPGPAGHFRTSAHASPLFAAALARLLERLDEALGRPDPIEVVDVGAGRGELLTALAAAVPAGLRARLRATAVELAPAGEPTSPTYAWSTSLPASITGLLLGTEWLDNVPVDVAEVPVDVAEVPVDVAELDDRGVPRRVLVDPATGDETLGDPVAGADAAWLARWWPLTVPGSRAELGHPRDQAWAAAVAAIDRGAALAVDYGHEAANRPPFGSLAGYQAGRQVDPIPDGTRDLTAHVAIDAVRHAGEAAAAARPAASGSTLRQQPSMLVRQSQALTALGISGARPPHELATRDPGEYLRRLAAAGAAAELTDPTGLGGHYWLLQPVALPDRADVTGWLT
ncbi:SAM-dependent methyltransferase [Natronosporangium hydrolyticum]|uniref:SAM-dependent methyltransferase n=1 Tax=Natronosporangium hydrolyticum TaxID=2811111 RepID=A0A895YGN3_9ACTN|nr:SAM-dependent methyltransferase [Natronosporangium hydrolyticum]QSB17044.1 SAM-dependent methyltransferase [Natronosporangium hydrolyticum]